VFDEYEEVSKFYGDRQAERSGLPYMQHIDEGLYILAKLGGTDAAQRAFALHPLIQGRDDYQDSVNKGVLDRAFRHGRRESAEAVALAIEYRFIANSYTSRMPESESYKIVRSPLKQVNLMLKADKIQNYKDALLNVIPKYPEEAERLVKYFNHYMEWFEISTVEFQEWVVELGRTFPLRMNADNFEDVVRYLTARVATWSGQVLGKSIIEVEGGVEAWVTDNTGHAPLVRGVYYVYASERGKGYYKRWVDKWCKRIPAFQVITENDCGIVDYLNHLRVPYKVVR
jgi:hypothetical protein